MKTIIVEDNVQAANDLNLLLGQDPEIEVLGIASTIDQARNLIEKFRPELLMMDIQMDADQTTTFDLLQELKDQQLLRFEIIFMSAHRSSDYVLKALKLSCLDYVLKPISDEALQAALTKVKKVKSGWEMLESQIQLAIRYKDNQLNPSSPIFVPSLNNTLEKIDLSGVSYIETTGNSKMTLIHFVSDRKPFACNKSIGYFKELLGLQFGFFMIHESRIINLKHLVSFDLNEHLVHLQTSKERIKLISSRRHGKMLKDYLKLGELNKIQEEKSNLAKRIWQALRGI